MTQDSRWHQVFKKAFYSSVRGISRLLAVMLLDYRIKGQENMPDAGPVIVLSNHQSTLDPVLIGISFRRRLEFLAKKSLFNNFLFGFIIRTLDAIPIDRERGGLDGLRAMIQKMRDGKAMVLFPEGTRSRDGQLLPVKGGFIAVARRTKATLLPMSLVGANEVMRRDSMLPHRSRVSAVIDIPIPPEEYEQLSDDEIVQLVQSRIHRSWEQAQLLRKS